MVIVDKKYIFVFILFKGDDDDIIFNNYKVIVFDL